MKTKTPPLLVAIVGGSGAGKTWLAEKLQAFLGPEATRLALDDFYRDRSHLPITQRARINFDHPRAIDWAAVQCALRDYLAGRPVHRPVYDFRTHCRMARTKVLPSKPVLIMDGLWLLRRPSLRRLFDLRIFIDCPTRARWRRRLARDLRSRGRSRTWIGRQFWETVEPMHRRFVTPQRRWADLVLPGTFGQREVKQIAEWLRKRAVPGIWRPPALADRRKQREVA
jgi:uridine kinase